jgi:hypothetical protein
LLWALDYNAASGSVQGNYSITGKNQPIMSFGEDQSGEIYFTTPFGQLFQFKSGQ